jgi:hypothetical protein
VWAGIPLPLRSPARMHGAPPTHPPMRLDQRHSSERRRDHQHLSSRAWKGGGGGGLLGAAHMGEWRREQARGRHSRGTTVATWHASLWDEGGGAQPPSHAHTRHVPPRLVEAAAAAACVNHHHRGRIGDGRPQKRLHVSLRRRGGRRGADRGARPRGAGARDATMRRRVRQQGPHETERRHRRPQPRRTAQRPGRPHCACGMGKGGRGGGGGPPVGASPT